MNIISRTVASRSQSPLSMIDESERLEYFAQSARTVGGKRAEYRGQHQHDWRLVDLSFDHAFGTERIKPFLECNECDATKDVDEPDY